MPFAHPGRQQPGVDLQQADELGSDSNDSPERHRRLFDHSPLVAWVDLCGAMARLIG